MDLSKAVGDLQKKSRSGPEDYDAENMLRALPAKRLDNNKYTNALVERHKLDPVFRYTCGFLVVSKVPVKPPFQGLSKVSLIIFAHWKDILENLVIKVRKLGNLDGKHITIDTRKLDLYDTSVSKYKIIQDGEYLDRSLKRNTKSKLAVAVNVTPTRVNEGIMVLPLVEDTKPRYSGIIRSKYYMRDIGYDFVYIYRMIHDRYNAQAIIPINRMSTYALPEGLDFDCIPLCSIGYRIAY